MDSRNRLTAKQQRFFEDLHAFFAREGAPPTVREMQAIGGFRSPRSVAQYLDALEAAGYIHRGHGARNVRLLREPTGAGAPDRADTAKIPVVGTVRAGTPALAAENVESYVNVAVSLARPGYTYFLLRVSGDSMDRTDIRDGDLVLVRQQATAQAGDIVVALIDDEATVKRLRLGNGVIVLEPESSNPEHCPIVLNNDFRIQGRVVATV